MPPRRAVYVDPEKTVGSVSVGMLDFIPLPRNPGELIGKRRQSVHVRKGMRDRYPFPALIWDLLPFHRCLHVSVLRGSYRRFYRRGCFPPLRAFFASLLDLLGFPLFFLFPI